MRHPIHPALFMAFAVVLLLPTPLRAQTPGASPVAATIHDRDVTFESAGLTLHGSLMAPTGITTPGPGALIISGSGPTDRNGNSPGLTTLNTNLNLAETLAAHGVTSLRYDKLGSGETGLAGITDLAAIDASLFLQEAADAAAFLVSQSGVDPDRLILVGHSEGALFALQLAATLTANGTPPAALILVAPLSLRYLDLLQEQITTQLDQAVAGQLLTAEAAAATSAELTAIITSLRATGALPEQVTDPTLQALFNPANLAFLVEADTWNPATIAAELPPALPVLVLLGEKDSQVTVPQVETLMAGFTTAGNDNATLVLLPNANHLLKVVPGTPNPAIDYVDPSLPFDPAAVQAIADFLTRHQLASN
jgi:pimeloyl-ACP methyl ester carboxylesterase